MGSELQNSRRNPEKSYLLFYILSKQELVSKPMLTEHETKGEVKDQGMEGIIPEHLEFNIASN